jgi:rubrerythrin
MGKVSKVSSFFKKIIKAIKDEKDDATEYLHLASEAEALNAPSSWVKLMMDHASDEMGHRDALKKLLDQVKNEKK